MYKYNFYKRKRNSNIFFIISPALNFFYSVIIIINQKTNHEYKSKIKYFIIGDKYSHIG